MISPIEAKRKEHHHETLPNRKDRNKFALKMSAKVEEKPRPAAPVEDDYPSESDYSDSDDDYGVPRQQNQELAQRQQQRQQQQQQPGQVAAPQQQPKEKGHSGAPSVRLDLNIELEVTLKARIHGDLTLALL